MSYFAGIFVGLLQSLLSIFGVHSTSAPPHLSSNLDATNTVIVSNKAQISPESPTGDSIPAATSTTNKSRLAQPSIHPEAATQNPKQVSELPIEVNKEPVAQTQITTTSQQNSSLDSNASDIADLDSTINAAIIQLNNVITTAHSFNARIYADSAELSPYIVSFSTYANATISANNTLLSEVQDYIGKLQTASSQAKSGGSIDKQYWILTGIPNIVTAESTYSQQELFLQQTYGQGLSTIAQALLSKSTVAVPTQQVDPCVSYASQASQVDQQVRDSITQGGGFATESQVEGQVRSKLAQDGIYPPLGCHAYY